MTNKTGRIAYRATTGFAAIALSAAGATELLRLPATMESLARLGYPSYFASILGTWLVLGSAAILAPGLSRVKEWAYGGMFFTLTGAALSHAASGDPMGKILVPLLVLGAVVASWALRSSHRVPVAGVFAAPRAA